MSGARQRTGSSKYKDPDFAGILDPSGKLMCTGVVSGWQAGQLKPQPMNAPQGAALKVIGLRNLLQKLIGVRAAECAVS
jgi:hypothetical protein